MKKFDVNKKLILGIEKDKLISSRTALRASVSLIPYIGGALDHLIFDKSDEIRIQNIEKVIEFINNKISSMEVSVISKEWFESVEALQMFRKIIENYQFEDDERKIKTAANIFAASGTKEFEKDPNKFAVMDRVSYLTTVQKEILLRIAEIKPRERDFSTSQFSSRNTAIWIDDIFNKLKSDSNWLLSDPQFNLRIEIGILESLNFLVDKKVWLANYEGYYFTEFGKLALRYLKI